MIGLSRRKCIKTSMVSRFIHSSVGRFLPTQRLAQTGEGLRDGEVIEWFVGPGDAIKQYDLLCRVQSDKATIDVTSAFDGTIRSLSASVGDVVAVGEPLCVFSDGCINDYIEEKVNKKDDEKGRNNNNNKLISYRRSMLHAMQQASLIPHCHAFDSIYAPKMSTPVAVKALAKAVGRVPIMHATLDQKNESYTLPKGVHVGIAVGTPSGLVVPCVRDVQDKSIEDIASEIARLRRRAIEQRLAPEDIKGGTITLSNIGSIGLVSGLGVIQPTQTALVTVGKVVNDTVQVSVSADHRLVDGAILSTFLTEFKRALGDVVPYHGCRGPASSQSSQSL